jgi:hypothetical protein
MNKTQYKRLQVIVSKLRKMNKPHGFGVPVTTFKMEFFSTSIDTLKVLVTALGAGLAIWGVINLLEGYGNDNPGAKSQGMKQLMAGGGVVLIALKLIPLLSKLFNFTA